MRIILVNIVILAFLIQLKAQSLPSGDISHSDFVVPAKGKIASMFGWRTQKNKIGLKERKYHRGLDIAGKWGEKIYATAEGEVVFVGRNAGYGLFIEIKHDDRYSSGYGHLKKAFVKKGDRILQGEIIGEMGNTGTTFSTIGGKGIHLHFEIRDNKKKVWYSPKGAVDPLELINKDRKFIKYENIEYQPEPLQLEALQASLLPVPDIQNIFFSETESEIPLNVEGQTEITQLTSKEIKPLDHDITINDNLKLREENYSFTTFKKEENILNYALQVEAHNVQLSEKEVKALELKYQTTGIRWDEVKLNGKTWYKYTIGCFGSLEEAREYKYKFKSEKGISSSGICILEGNKIIKTIW